MSNSNRQEYSLWASIIYSVKTYLGFFTFVILIVEAVLTGVALNLEGTPQLVVVYTMVFIIVALIIIVVLFAWKKPYQLLFTFQSEQQTPNFAMTIAGNWWQRNVTGNRTVLSFVSIIADLQTHSVKIKGEGYNLNGNLETHWESIGSWIKPNENIVGYYWEGYHVDTPDQKYEGIGRISFTKHESSGTIEIGSGYFDDLKLSDIKSKIKISSSWRRFTKEEKKKFDIDSGSIHELVQKNLNK